MAFPSLGRCEWVVLAAGATHLPETMDIPSNARVHKDLESGTLYFVSSHIPWLWRRKFYTED